MHNIGDLVLYSAAGVMKIVDIREENIAGESNTYYVLSPLDAVASSLTLIPTGNTELVARMRPLLSAEELMAVLREAKGVEPAPWIEDGRKRADAFNKIILEGDRKKLMAMIGAIYEAGKKRALEGKKNFLSDENAMKKAEKLLYSEISAVMDIPYKDIPRFISEL